MRPYRAMVRLYPRSFREEFGEDVVDLFDDLASNRGRFAAWRICGLDLLVTIPRQHLERIMNERTSSTILNWTIVLLVAAGAASYLTGVYPGVVLLGAALVVAASQRSALARAIRVPDTARRRRRFRTAGALAAIFAASYLTFLAVIGESWTGRETVLAVIGTVSMVGAIVYAVAGLLTPRSPREVAGFAD